MSEFSTIQIPPNSTGAKIVQTSVLESHYRSLVDGKEFLEGDQVTSATGLQGTVVKVKVKSPTTGEIECVGEFRHSSSVSSFLFGVVSSGSDAWDIEGIRGAVANVATPRRRADRRENSIFGFCLMICGFLISNPSVIVACRLTSLVFG